MGFAISVFLLIFLVNPQKSSASFLKGKSLSKYYVEDILKVQFIGEIVSYSYIRLDIVSTGDPKRYKNGIIPLKGNCYEAINGKTYKIIGSYNTNTLVWKLDCFSENNTHMAVFMGKENADGNIDGKWSNMKITRSFYLKKV